MAKLPKVKNKAEEVDGAVNQDVDLGTTEDQTDAVTGIIDRAADTVSGSDGSDEPDVEETTENDELGGDEEVSNPSESNDFGVTIEVPKNTVPTKATTVKVATVCDHSCHIGGKLYQFKRGVPTSVPEPVKQILKNAGLLAAL